MSAESFYTDICVFCSCFLVVIVIIVLKLRFQMWMLIFSVFHWLLLIISGNLSLSLWPVTLWPSCLTLPVFLPCSLSLTRMSFWPVCLSLWPVWLSLYLSLTLTFLVPTCPSFWLVSLSLPPSDLFVSLNWLSLSPPISLYLSVSLSCVYLHLSPWPFFSLCLSLWAFSLSTCLSELSLSFSIPLSGLYQLVSVFLVMSNHLAAQADILFQH